MNPPANYRERVHCTAVKQEDGQIWLRLTACNAPYPSLPHGCFLPGQTLIVEIVRQPCEPKGSR